MMRRPVVVAVVVLIVVAMVLAAGAVAITGLLADDGGGPDRPDQPVRTTPAADATVAPEPGLEPFYSQSLEWSECEAFWCSQVRVPLDYADPGGETIDLAVLMVPARDPEARIASLVVNPGGPGAPGTSYAAQAALAFRAPLLDRFDVVGFDPRGTGSSAPVDCLTDEQLDDYLAGDPDPDTAEEQQEFVAWSVELGRGCAERSGDLAAHVSTVEAARDLDVLRAVLGESTLTYFGASYGTKLGATYADLFPDRVGRLVLDGAVDPALPARELSLGQAEGFETALRAYVGDCVESDDDCFLGDSVDEGVGRIREFLDSVDDEPLETGGERDLAVGNAFYGIVAPLYNRDYWFLLSQALQRGLDGDGSMLLELSDLYSSRGPGGYLDNSSEAIYAINCLDDPWSIPAAEVPAQYADFERASPTFGRVFAWGLTGCEGIEVEAAEEPPVIDAPGTDPILVIGTTRDPATPMAWAEALADQLESGVLVRRDGDGHTGYNMGNACVDDAVESYLVDGGVPEDGLSC
ncbi:alpha/beta hydrolase [Nocardioides ferulae]|uniref:alpha/beta hydrolase n=1 Tax=Nocardioides ferulae TaxID=2340821 RepID=UPI001F0C2ED9|nr:alpha/beta hydrolase [Nocardioides ferulae]